MKRVLVLNHFAVPPGASGGTRHTELFSRLSGWSFLIVNASTSAGVPVKERTGSGFLSVWASPYSSNGMRRILNWGSYATTAVARLWNGRRPDVVYASSPHLLAGLAGLILARRWKVPLILEVRDLWPQVLVDMNQMSSDSPIYQALEQLEALLYAQANMIVVLAQGTSDTLERRGIPREKMTFIPNGADSADFSVSEPCDILRTRYGFNRFTCVYLGAHGPANGLDLLLDAAGELRGEDLDIVLVGKGLDKDRLVITARERALGNVRFLDAVPKSEVKSILAAADVGLHVLADVPLFRYGISPNKVFDYLASGLPLITNVPGEIGDLVTNSGGGLVVEPTGLADGIRLLRAAAPDELSEMGARGRAFLDANQSRTAMAARLQELLDAAV